ncbi:MAG: acyl-CoA dehydrogenase family protein [Planctomycetes bacterium]|nr:acyl-CoA dehydrogenase family protein [Planctomycetota bacterium]
MTSGVLGPFLEKDHAALAERLESLEESKLVPALSAARSVEDKARRVAQVLAEEGLFALAVPSTYGGSHPEADVRGVCLVREFLAGVHGVADFVFATQMQGAYLVAQSAEEPLKSEVLRQVVEGKVLAAFASTEPDSGSDLGGIACSARRTSQAYVLNGTKTYVTNAGIADFFVVFARTDPAARIGGLTAFYVPASTEGLEVKPGPELAAPIPMGELVFVQCRVPRAHRLGAEGEGYGLAQQTLVNFRPATGAAAVGIARRALAEAVRHLGERRQFGRPLASFQALRFAIAEMATDLEAARSLVYRAAWALDHGESSAALSSQALLHAVETARRIVERSVQLLGARGLVAGETVERLSREVRLLGVATGTPEVQKMIVARALLGEVRRDASPPAT